MIFATKLVAIAFLSVASVSSRALPERFLSQTSAKTLSFTRPNDITLNYAGIAASQGTSQIIMLDSGLANVWLGGSVLTNDNCTVIFNVTGNGNTI